MCIFLLKITYSSVFYHSLYILLEHIILYIINVIVDFQASPSML